MKEKLITIQWLLGGLTLCLSCTVGDLRINSGGRKGLFSQCGVPSPHGKAYCSGGLCLLPTLLLFCGSVPQPLLSHLLAAKWNLLCFYFWSNLRTWLLYISYYSQSIQRKKELGKRNKRSWHFPSSEKKKNLKAWNQRSLYLKMKLSVLAEGQPKIKTALLNRFISIYLSCLCQLVGTGTSYIGFSDYIIWFSLIWQTLVYSFAFLVGRLS